MMVMMVWIILAMSFRMRICASELNGVLRQWGWWDKVLDVADNEISVLPTELLKLKKLRMLNLENNQLKRIPEILVEFPDLVTVKLSGNPMNQLYEVKLITQNHLPKIIDYLRDLKKGVVKSSEFKILVLGKEVFISLVKRTMS
jgi:hypothetical protein